MKSGNLHQVFLDQKNLEGFRNFINAWIYSDADKAFVVDPGPLTTIPVLLDALRRHGVERLDYILLTHIHIDHAGGTGELVRHFPHAQVICHPAGVKHMLEPQALWEGSLKVLGEVAQEYGEIVAVPAENIRMQSMLEDRSKLDEMGLEVLHTPGHAAHHLSFMFDDLLVGGEVAGVCCETPAGNYMRPATPPRFDLDIAINSLHKVMQRTPAKMIFAHSSIQDNAMHWLKCAEHQLYLWVKGIIEHMEEGGDSGEGETLKSSMYSWLLKYDSLFARIESMPADIMQRERYFFGNSINGMSEYVARIDKTQRREISARAGSVI
ncbi:MAG: MBL fold metallo-hydrolase [Thermodesulfobacteriota bacterium]